MEFSTNSPWWSWPFKHASWLMNRFNANRGVTAYELLHSKEYAGSICNFGEPVFGFGKVSGKGTAKWTRMVFLGKSDPQDTYILYTGSGLVITRSIRRISTVWRGHLPFYMNFKCWSWQYKTGVGGRVVLTKNQPQASSGSFNAPAGQIEPSAFFDEDAEAVRLKHLEEQREEAEVTEMALHDRPPPIEGVPTQEEPQRRVAPFAPEGGIFNDDDATENPHLPPDRVFSEPSSASAPMEVPQTPDVFATLPATPRGIPTTRMHDDQPGEEDHESKRARLESSKKQRVDRLSADYASMIRAVKSQQRPFIRWMNMNQTYNWMTILSKTFGKVKVRLQAMMYPQICGRLVAQTNILRSLQSGLTGLPTLWSSSVFVLWMFFQKTFQV